MSALVTAVGSVEVRRVGTPQAGNPGARLLQIRGLSDREDQSYRGKVTRRYVPHRPLLAALGHAPRGGVAQGLAVVQMMIVGAHGEKIGAEGARRKLAL